MIMNAECGKAMTWLRGVCRAATPAGTSVKARSYRGYLRSCDKGQTLVEFALILPLLMMCLTFMFAIGLAMLTYMHLYSATSNAAVTQLATARGASSDPCAAIVTSVTTTVPASLNASNLTYTVTIQNSSLATVTYGPTTGSGFSCTAAAAILGADNPDTPGTLTVSYPYTWIPVILRHMSGNFQASVGVTVY
jgi:Flp pilus assembly protein TadG